MAIFYNHIKGCASETTSINSGYWTWIHFTSTGNPTILTGNSMSAVQTDCGTIVTTNRAGLIMNQNLCFSSVAVVQTRIDNTNYSYLSTISSSEINFGNNSLNSTLLGKNISLTSSGTGDSDNISITSAKGITLTASTGFQLISSGSTISINSNQITLPQTINCSASTQSTSYQTGALIVTGGIGVGGNIHSNGSCNALYFNATSDERAKEHINPYLINALEIIKNIEVKTFNYLDNKDKVIGIIAQDIQKYDSESFSFVANEKADGIDGNYMSIKESKLIYLLWKGIQEQQKEIEDLKLQIEQLKK